MCNIFDLHQSLFVTLNFFYRKLYVRICFLHIQYFAIYKRTGKKRTLQKSPYISYKCNFNINWTLYWPSALCSSMARYSLASTSSLSLSSSSSHRVDTDSDSCCPDDTEVTRSCWVRFESYSWWVVSSIMSRSRDTEPCSRLLASVQKRDHTNQGIVKLINVIYFKKISVQKPSQVEQQGSVSKPELTSHVKQGIFQSYIL